VGDIDALPGEGQPLRRSAPPWLVARRSGDETAGAAQGGPPEALPNPGVVGQDVVFRDRAAAGAFRVWSFGDGSDDIATQETSAVHTFGAPGVFDARLDVTELTAGFPFFQQQSLTVQVLPGQEPKIELRGRADAQVDETISLAATADGCTPAPAGWSWEIDGGAVAGGFSGPALQVLWAAPGSKRVVARNTACGDASAATTVTVQPGEPPAACVPSPTTLCLLDNRFRVEVTWDCVDSTLCGGIFAGQQGPGTAVQVTAETGYFWFFGSENVDLFLKIIDGRAITGAFWVFYGSLSNVEYTITVTDTVTGRSKVYSNPDGSFGSVGDIAALPAN